MIILTQAQQSVWLDSKALWTHAAQSVPGLLKARSNLAQIYLDEENFDRALEHVDCILERQPENANALHMLGRIYVRQHRGQEAIAVLSAAIQAGLGPTQGAGHLSLAEAYVAAGDADAARDACAHAIALGLTPAACYSDLGDAAMRFAGRYDLAVECFRLAVSHQPESALLHWNLGTALRATGQDSEALHAYEQALALTRKQGLHLPELEQAAGVLRQQLQQATSSPANK
jgi:tetratricopeptide (TPR) repeat protein